MTDVHHHVVSDTADEARISLVHGLERAAGSTIVLASLVPFCAGAVLEWRRSHSLDISLVAAAAGAMFVAAGKGLVDDMYAQHVAD